MADDKLERPSWTVRRRLINLTLAFCAGSLVYLMGWAPDDELRNTIAMGLILLAGSTLGSYVFGAAWDDKNFMDALSRRKGGGDGL